MELRYNNKNICDITYNSELTPTPILVWGIVLHKIGVGV